jgi:hypothetical protein
LLKKHSSVTASISASGARSPDAGNYRGCRWCRTRAAARLGLVQRHQDPASLWVPRDPGLAPGCSE